MYVCMYSFWAAHAIQFAERLGDFPRVAIWKYRRVRSASECMTRIKINFCIRTP